MDSKSGRLRSFAECDSRVMVFSLWGGHCVESSGQRVTAGRLKRANPEFAGPKNSWPYTNASVGNYNCRTSTSRQNIGCIALPLSNR